MSKTRWILLCVVVCMFIFGPATQPSPDIDSRPMIAENASVDWCCVSGLPCCTIPPSQAE